MDEIISFGLVMKTSLVRLYMTTRNLVLIDVTLLKSNHDVFHGFEHFPYDDYCHIAKYRGMSE
jgi:hypothetical protein